MKVKVTQEDIDKGWFAHGFHCPIAKAIKRDMPEYLIVVGSDGVDIYPKGESDPIQYDLPQNAQQFIRDFDEMKPVSPFEFNLL